ncbi:DUF3757 domain-containing protein [Pseudomonas yamanorum]
MSKMIFRSFFLLQLAALSGMADSADSLDNTRRLTENTRSFETCPSPLDVKNKNGIFTASANQHAAKWTGVLIDSEHDYTIKFKKAYFFVLDRETEKLGFLEKCTYLTFSGKHLDLRLSIDSLDRGFMRVGDTSWKPSRDIPSPLVFECTAQFRDACGVSLQTNSPSSNL